MGNCVVVQRERTWADDGYDSDFEFSEKHELWHYHEKESKKEVKIKITKKQLKELLGSEKSTSLERALEEIIKRGIVYHDGGVKEGHWKPRLGSIPEGQEQR